MHKKHLGFFAVLLATVFVSLTLFEGYALARAGGGRSMGSRGSRSFSRPAAPPSYGSYGNRSSQQPQNMQQRQFGAPYQQPQPAGGFLRGMGGGILGGIAGGLLGGMLFRSLGMGGGMGGMGGGMGGGIGIFEILLIAGGGYLIYRLIKSRRQAAAPQFGRDHEGGYERQPAWGQQQENFSDTQQADGPEAGLDHIRRMDASFSEERFRDMVMDVFFKVQSSWMKRELAPVSALISEEIRRRFQEDIDRMLAEKRINHLENVAVRTVTIVEAWQEKGEDFITTQIYANLLDYVTDMDGRIVEGSGTEPVKFEEFWTFSRPVGAGAWRLASIDQK